MSKNFELMQNIGIGLENDPVSDIPRVSPIPVERRGGSRINTFPFDQQAHEECLQLVQRLFLLHDEPPHCVVFAGVEHGNGCSWICAQAAELLSENTPGIGLPGGGQSTIAVADASIRSGESPRPYRRSSKRRSYWRLHQTAAKKQSLAALLWIFDP